MRFLLPLALASTGLLLAQNQYPEVQLDRSASTSIHLRAGDMVEVTAGVANPSQLPVNGRVAVEFGGYRKIVHALDPDFYIVFRAPKAGLYSLKATVVEDEEAIFNLPRWRESGWIQKVSNFPKQTPWPLGKKVAFRLAVKPVSFGVARKGIVIEAEPNDSIATAQTIAMGASNTNETIRVTGGADDLEYFDNGLIGKAGDDWFRIEFKGSKPRLFTANLNVTDPFVVSQVQCFTADGKEYRDGANANERVHQQLEGHRTGLTRTFQPGGVYFVRVESNSPGYDLELRLRELAPHTDPREAVRAAMYDHISQVDAWLLNRPRGAAVDRRIRDTGSLLGTHCMSCHTQSGVWGPAGAMQHGYRVENVMNYRHLINVMYECLRPTNELPEAANNTSLSPLDLGDGPAGTRAAGFNVATIEKMVRPRRLHSTQQIRTANYMLLSADPSGINAAGPGSNVGQSVVYRFAGEVLLRGWRDTGNDKYLKAVEEKVQKLLDVRPRYTDDFSNRIEFLVKAFPQNWVALRGDTDEAKAFWKKIQDRIAEDEKELRRLQKSDGAWGFDPKGSTDPKDTDPAPTALALTALSALGHDDRDPAVKRGVEAMLRMQDTYGRWNRNALTGFVTTAYAIHAFSRLYPVEAPVVQPKDFAPPANGMPESVADSVARFRALAHLGLLEDANEYVDLILAGVKHSSAHVRYWAYMGLGAFHNERGVPALLAGLSDPVKMVRESARWALRQTLLDDKGWDQLIPFYATAPDLAREQIAAALVMRADAVMPRSAVSFAKLTGLLDRMMNQDPSPAVRAWAARAAWNWWIWNPPVRENINASIIRMLEREEPNVLAENAMRYQTEALFIANGQKANPSPEHQYPELTRLFKAIEKRIESPQPSQRLIDRLVGIAATYYSQAGGDGGPGQMGYITPGASDMMGKAVMTYWKQVEAAKQGSDDKLRLAVESAANIIFDPLQKKLLDYSASGPEHLRTIAATSISDPRIITLNAAQEFVEPLIEQFYRGANEEERRAELAGPLVKLFSRSRWNMPKTDEQLRIFYKLIMPDFPEERGKLEENTRPLKQMDKDSKDWYIARALGGVLHGNPDLQTAFAVSLIPDRFKTPMEEMYWLPGIKWTLEQGRNDTQLVDLYLKAIGGGVDNRLRNKAIELSGDVNIRKHPRIAPALRKVMPQYYEPDPPQVTSASPEWKKNWEFFRDKVAPEFVRPNRDDQMACLGCHGVPGRVPSLELANSDDRGYVKVADLYSNYKKLMERVNESDVENSKLLRKPLNVQSGKEDGHQGGVRYRPGDAAYQVLKQWVSDTAALKKGSK
jgi:hypothetical protein